jgi:PRTRC genetic system ParB family protein
MNTAEVIETPNAVEATAPKQAAFVIPANLIHKIPGHNPRKIRAANTMTDMLESIREKGVLQPILVRPHPELDKQFQLVAGETRYDLSVECGYAKIPVLIRNIADEDLLSYATAENVHRANMLSTDEGEAAKALLIKHDGDKELVCKELGWSRSKLDGRIQLTHCITEVRQSLADEKINIGHAEILSGLRESSQKSALDLVLRKGMTADDLRQRIDAASLQLAVAAFDTAECASCQHNSSTQASLFDASTGSGKCLNKVCFDQKTEDHLQATKADLIESYNRVELSRDVAADTTAIIATSGPTGLGEEQFNACVACEHYGATISSQIGNRAQVSKNVCFNVSCNKKMVKAYQSVINPEAAPAGKAAATATPEAGAKASDKKAKAEPKKAATPAAILTINHEVHRAVAATNIVKVERDCLIVSLISLMADTSGKPVNVPEGWPTSLHGKNRAVAAGLLDKMDDKALQEIQQTLVAQALHTSKKDGTESSDSFGALAEWYSASRECDLTEHFTLNSDYLNHFTKPVIGQILAEAKFDEAYDKANGEKAFSKLIKGKKGDIIEAVKKSDFDFKGFIPAKMKL